MANTKKKDRICVDCGLTFLAYPPAKRCASCAEARYKGKLSSHRGDASSRIITCKIVCGNCGTIYESPTITKYCASCAIMRTREYNRKHGKITYAARKKNGWKRVCANCKMPFLAKNSSRKLCDDCFAQRRKRISQANRQPKDFDAEKCIYVQKRKNGETAYKACVHWGGKQIHLGYFSTRDEAKQARIDAYNKYSKEDKP